MEQRYVLQFLAGTHISDPTLTSRGNDKEKKKEQEEEEEKREEEEKEGR